MGALARIHKGFTLIELLVVIAIIGLLSSIVLASLSTARAKARDARRESDTHSLQVALELYYADHGSYPNCSRPTNDVAGSKVSMTCLLGALSPTYIKNNVQDPGYPNASYAYDQWCNTPNGGGPGYYRLWATLENTAGVSNLWWGSSYGLTDCQVAP